MSGLVAGLGGAAAPAPASAAEAQQVRALGELCGAQPAACLAALRAHGGNIDLAAGTLLSADGAP
jgi:hypothetical protein